MPFFYNRLMMKLTQKPSEVILEANEGSANQDVKRQLEKGQFGDNRVIYTQQK